MNDFQKQQLVGATLRSGEHVMQKSASATSSQNQILEAGWPKEDEQITKVARLARMLGTGYLVEEAEAAAAEA